MPSKRKKKTQPKSPEERDFYTASFIVSKEHGQFYPEATIILKTVDAVNSFNYVYRVWRTGARGGPSTHAQQDLCRAMLIFSCAGLDVLVKQLIRTKLPALIATDGTAEGKFKEYVKRGLKKNDKEILNTVALALIDRNPREVFLNEYLGTMTEDSLQSVEELCRVSEASGLDTKAIFGPEKRNLLRDVFVVRNEIIHEMDITVTARTSNKTNYRTRRQRRTYVMEKYTYAVLDLAQELFSAYKKRFEDFKIGTEKTLK